MRKDTSFSDRKLSMDEFSQKYWKNGETPYQYHTVGIEDGRDEREQLVLNNIRALYQLIKFCTERRLEDWAGIWDDFIGFSRAQARPEMMTREAAMTLALEYVKVYEKKLNNTFEHSSAYYFRGLAQGLAMAVDCEAEIGEKLNAIFDAYIKKI